MKKYLIIAIVLFYGCGEGTSLRGLKNPIIVVAKDSATSIILRDADGIFWVGRKGYYDGNAMISSYSVGDTIK